MLTLTGRQLARLLPGRYRPFALFFLSPIIGLAVYVLIATIMGWIVGTRSGIVVPITAGIAFISWWRERHQKGLGSHVVVVCGVSATVTIGLLMTIWSIGGYNVFNDTFTYLAHAQWLQSHSFRHYASPTIYEPAFTQIAIYQALGFRMGASFFFGWVQAASPFDWSIHVYPAVVAIALACGSLAIGGLVYALVGRRMLSLGWGVAVGSGISGFTFGGFAGFLPQLFGLSLTAGFLTLLIRYRPRDASWRSLALGLLPLSILFAAVGLAYSELLPLLTLSTCAWFIAILLFDRSKLHIALLAGAIFASEVLLLLNGECFRIFHALSVQKGAIVGWPISWSILDFAAHSAGMRSGSSDGDQWLLPASVAIAVLYIAVAVASWSIIRECKRHRELLLRWTAPLAYIFVCIAGFMYFRFGVAAPWPTGVGQTWNQFKLSNWISPVLLATIGAGILGSTRRHGALPGIIIAVGLALNFHTHYRLTSERISETIRLSGRSTDPFKTFMDMRQLAMTAEPAGAIYLDLGGSEHKSRQLTAYFLQGYKVTADWSEDGYIYPFLPDGWRRLEPNDSKWWIHRAGHIDGTPAGTKFRSGSLVFGPTPEFLASREAVAGGHGVESDESGWWTWAPENVHVNFRIHGKLPAQIRLKFTCLMAVSPRTLTLTLRHGKSIISSQQITLGEGWQNYVSEPFQIDGPELEIEIRSAGHAIPISTTDSRPVTFLAKNVRLELAPGLPHKE